MTTVGTIARCKYCNIHIIYTGAGWFGYVLRESTCAYAVSHAPGNWQN